MNIIDWLCGKPKPNYGIELFLSADGWRWRIRHSNGNILATSEAYSAKGEAQDTVANLAKATRFPVSIVV